MPTAVDLDTQQGLTPPAPGEEVNPKIKIKKLKNLKTNIQRRRVTLSDAQKIQVKLLLRQSWEEWDTNTANLRSKLRRANDLMEGVKEPKTFPWPDSSNLHIPLIEIHITICHSVVAATMLDMDPIWYIKALIEGLGENVDKDIEKFLHWKSKSEWNIDTTLSDIYWTTYRDGTGIGDLDWVEQYEDQYDIRRYEDIKKFQADFQDEVSAGISKKEYQEYVKSLLEDDEIQILVKENVPKYRGPKLRIVELKDFIVVPTTAPDLDYAQVIGDAFIQRANYFRSLSKSSQNEEAWLDKTEVDKMCGTAGLTNTPDQISQSQDQIEGIARTRVGTPDEYWCMQGVVKIDLSGDGVEEKYLFMYHKDSDCLLRFERYPYIHNRMKYIIWRFKKRPNRLMGQSLYDQLVDLNDEVDTQHNQRVDSRTITTVPSFMKLTTADFDPARKDQRFRPGVTFQVTNFNQFKQLEIKQTDMGQSMQEEQNLFFIADTRTGASQSRTGRENSRDPRASGKKLQQLVQQSNQRLDDHMRELRLGTAELGSQLLELCYQFCPDLIPYPKFNQDTKKYVMDKMDRKKLRNRNMVLEVARTTMADNPSQQVQRELTKYQLLSREPLIGGNMIRRRELLFRLLTAWRERDIEKLVPTVEEIQKEMQAQQQKKSNDPNDSHSNLVKGIEGDADGEKPQTKDDKGIRGLDTSNETAPVQS